MNSKEQRECDTSRRKDYIFIKLSQTLVSSTKKILAFRCYVSRSWFYRLERSRSNIRVQNYTA